MTEQVLKRDQLGVASVVFFVVAAAAPLVGMTGAAPLAMVLGNGAAVPGAYLLVGLVLLLFSVGYTSMSLRITNAGAFFAYIGAGLGARAGLGAAYTSLLAYWAIQVAIYGFFGGLMNMLWGLMPWWAWSLLACALVTALSCRRVEVGARVLGGLLVLEMLCLLITALAIFASKGLGAVPWAAAFSPTAIFSGGLGGASGIALAFAVASFIGFEATAIYSEESKDPQNTVGKATYWAVGLITVFFALTTLAMVTALGAEQAVDEVLKRSTVDDKPLTDPAAVLFSLAEQYVGPWMSQAMGLLVLSSLFAGLLAFQNAAARYAFALARVGALPRAWHRVNGAGAPIMASLLTTGVALLCMVLSALSGFDPMLKVFAWGSGVAVVAILTIEIAVCFAVWSFFSKQPGLVNVWRSTVAPWLSALLMSVGLYLLVSRFGLLTGEVLEGVDPATTAWGLNALGWSLLCLPYVVFVLGMLLAPKFALFNEDLLKS